jgi:DNA-binding LacI/PurR family transcriptional regulator
LLELLRRRGQAVVVEGYPVGSIDVDAVVNDELVAVELALRHLTELGHRRIVYASGEPSLVVAQTLRYFPVVARWAELECGTDSILLAGTRLGESSHEHMLRYLVQYLANHDRLPFTAMIVGGDASALGVLEALKEAGLSVPQDVSLIVLDNPDLATPGKAPLTMLGRTSQRIAEDLVKRVQWRLDHPTEPYGTIYETPELVVRGSTQLVTKSGQ